MASWIFILLITVAFIIFLKTTGFRYGRTITYLIGAALLFFVVTFIFVSIKADSNLTNFDGFITGIRTYFFWLANFGETSARITGSVVKEIGTNITEITKVNK